MFCRVCCVLQGLLCSVLQGLLWFAVFARFVLVCRVFFVCLAGFLFVLQGEELQIWFAGFEGLRVGSGPQKTLARTGDPRPLSLVKDPGPKDPGPKSPRKRLGRGG